MRAERDRAARDTRHNKDHDNLKSSLKKDVRDGKKSKKHRVVFDESANEFFEADYIIVVRDEYSDEGEGEECSGCGSCERYQEGDAGALSPPEGYKDLGLFNRDGTLREQAWWEAGDVVLVGERSGTVFTPQHLQLLRRLQRERMLRSTICADCDAHAALHQPIEMEYSYEDEEGSDDRNQDRDRDHERDLERDRDRDRECDRELRSLQRRTGKHIAAGEERPRINSSQQTTPTEDDPPEICVEDTEPEVLSVPVTSEESDTGENDGRLSGEGSPQRHRLGGILKGGRLWKSLDKEIEKEDQNDDQRSITTVSDEDGSVTRSVRFVERPPQDFQEPTKENFEGSPIENETGQQKEYSYSSHRMGTPLILSMSAPKTNSAVQQLFNSSRPPPPAIEPQVVTSETLRAWDAGGRPKSEDAAVRRVAERNALRCSLLRSEARKKQQPKQETRSLAERIRLLTCDVEDEQEVISDKGYKASDKGSDKAFGSVSSSSSSSTLSAPAPVSVVARNPPPAPDLGDVHQATHKHKAKGESVPRRQFLSTLAPLTACVGSAAHHEGFYYVPPGDRSSASSATNLEFQEHSDTPAPDVVAGTPDYHHNALGSGEEDGLAAFARASAPRTDRLRQRYDHDSQPASSDDEHDDYGFHRRPAVRGIAVKQQLAASEDILALMQGELQPQTSAVQLQQAQCQQNSNYSWQYYSEANLNSRPQSRASANSNWSSKSPEYMTRQCNNVVQHQQQHTDACYAHAQNLAYAHYQQRQQDAIYRNCSLYANIGCSDSQSSQELYSSSSEHTSPVRRRPESPPPIRPSANLMYLAYSDADPYHHDAGQQWNEATYNRAYQYHPQGMNSGSSVQASTPLLQMRASYAHALRTQTLCPAPARYRPVPAPQPGGGKQMICYSEKVVGPVYQPAPGSPSRATRGAPEGAPSSMHVQPASSPMAPSPNPVYYAMNV